MIQLIGRNKKEINIEKPEKVVSIFKSLNITDDEYVAILNGNPALNSDVVNPEDELTILEIFSGG